MATDKKVTGGSNKAHQGMSEQTKFRIERLIYTCRHRPPTYSQARQRKRSRPTSKDCCQRRKGSFATRVYLAVFLLILCLQAMQTARLEKGLSQKDVAQKINEKPSVLQDYESSKAIPNPQILGKLERVLGVKLRGKFFW